MYKQDLAFNNLQGLICHKTRPTINEKEFDKDFIFNAGIVEQVECIKLFGSHLSESTLHRKIIWNFWQEISIPEDLDMYYYYLIKSYLCVWNNTPNNLVLIKSGMHMLNHMIFILPVEFLYEIFKKLTG